MIPLYLSAAAMALTAFLHSWFGEKRLIRPLLEIDVPMIGNPRVARLIRSAWHYTSVLMLLSAVTVAWPGTPAGAILAIGAVWTMLGLYSLAGSRGKHLGWPPLLFGGLFAIGGALS